MVPRARSGASRTTSTAPTRCAAIAQVTTPTGFHCPDHPPSTRRAGRRPAMVDRQEVEALYQEARESGGSIGHVDSSRSEEHTSELQSRGHLVCRLLLEKQ